MVCAVCLDRYGFLERPFFQGVFLKKNEKQTFQEAAPCGTLRLRIASFVCFQASEKCSRQKSMLQKFNPQT